MSTKTAVKAYETFPGFVRSLERYMEKHEDVREEDKMKAMYQRICYQKWTHDKSEMDLETVLKENGYIMGGPDE